jgi:hypothetical protein
MRLTVTVILLALATITVETFSVEPYAPVLGLAIAVFAFALLHWADIIGKPKPREGWTCEELCEQDGVVEWPWPTRGEWKP